MILWNREGHKLHTIPYYTEKMGFCKGDNLQNKEKANKKTGTRLRSGFLGQKSGLRMDGDLLDGVAEIVNTGILGAEGDVGGVAVFHDQGLVLDPADDGIVAVNDFLVILEQVGQVVVFHGDGGAISNADFFQNGLEENTFQDHGGYLGSALSISIFKLIGRDVGLGQFMSFGLSQGVGNGFVGFFDDDGDAPIEFFQGHVLLFGFELVGGLTGAAGENGAEHHGKQEDGDNTLHTE